ncbi:MAG: MFS transporter [Alphaproteobacteria bacterium]|jgi:MFS family permease
MTEPTEPYYRWVILGVSAIMLAAGVGLLANGISVFLIPLSEEFGWERGPVSFINFSGLIGLAFGGIVMGRVADKIGPRVVSIIGAVTLGSCLVVASWADALWQFYLVFLVAGFAGGGSFFAPLVANVGNWFRSGVGLALGIVSAGQALGQGGVPFLGGLLISTVGWREAFLTMGVASLAILIPLSVLIRKPELSPVEMSVGTPDVSSEDATYLPTNIIVIWMSAAVVFCCICMAVPLMHLVPLAQDRSISIENAGSIVFVMLIAGVAGRLVFGKLADHIGAIRSYWLASFWQTVLVAVFLQFETLNGFYTFAVVYGFGYGGVMTGILVCMRVLTPVARRASALGIVLFFAWLGHAIGGYQGGLVFDFTGNYTWAYVNAAIAGAINLIIVAALYMRVSRQPSTGRVRPSAPRGAVSLMRTSLRISR